MSEIVHHPLRFAVRELVTAGAVVLVPVALVTIFWLVSWLRRIGVRMPSLPSLPLSGFDLTDLGAPTWLQDILDSSDYVTPLAIALIVIWLALRYRRHVLALQAQDADARHSQSTDSS